MHGACFFQQGAIPVKKKTVIASIIGLVYFIFIVCGFFFLDDADEFSENVFGLSFIYFGIAVFNFYCLKRNDNFIAEFIINHNLAFLLLPLSIIYSVVLVLSFVKGEGFDRLMFCTVWISVVNACLCSYAYLK